jgi:hypothetical protein
MHFTQVIGMGLSVGRQRPNDCGLIGVHEGGVIVAAAPQVVREQRRWMATEGRLPVRRVW